VHADAGFYLAGRHLPARIFGGCGHVASLERATPRRCRHDAPRCYCSGRQGDPASRRVVAMVSRSPGRPETVVCATPTSLGGATPAARLALLGAPRGLRLWGFSKVFRRIVGIGPDSPNGRVVYDSVGERHGVPRWAAQPGWSVAVRPIATGARQPRGHRAALHTQSGMLFPAVPWPATGAGSRRPGAGRVRVLPWIVGRLSMAEDLFQAALGLPEPPSSAPIASAWT
jgi:hypothetical protein